MWFVAGLIYPGLVFRDNTQADTISNGLVIEHHIVQTILDIIEYKPRAEIYVKRYACDAWQLAHARSEPRNNQGKCKKRSEQAHVDPNTRTYAAQIPEHCTNYKFAKQTFWGSVNSRGGQTKELQYTRLAIGSNICTLIRRVNGTEGV